MQSFEIVQRSVGYIADALQRHSKFDQVCIEKSEELPSLTVVERLPFDIAYQTICSMFSKSSIITDNATRHFFEHVFGKRRFEKICNEVFGHIPQTFSKNDIASIYVHAANVTYSDLQMLFLALKSDEKQVLFFTEEETDILKQKIQDAQTLEEVDGVIIEEFVQYLSPFARVEHVFFHQVPQDSVCIDSGKTWAGFRERVAIQEKVKKGSLTQEQWYYIVGKQLLDYEIPEGTLLRNREGGYHRVFRIISGGGAYKTCLLPIGKKAKDTNRYVLYRGTRPFPSATDSLHTIIDDIRPQLGSKGAYITFEETKSLLTAGNGFVDTEADTVVGIGFSLGGAHVSRDAVLHQNKFHSIITLGSPGIDKETCKRFVTQVSNKPTIISYIEEDDVIDRFGGAKLGLGLTSDKASVHVRVMCPGRSNPTLEEVIQQRRASRNSFLFYARFPFQFITSLLGSHNRITPQMQEYGVLHFSNESNDHSLQKILAHEGPLYDSRWERVRHYISRVVELENHPQFIRLTQVFQEVVQDIGTQFETACLHIQRAMGEINHF